MELNLNKLVELRTEYEQLDVRQYKTNIRYFYKKTKIKRNELMKILDLSYHTVDAILSYNKPNVPDIFRTIILAELFCVDPVELLRAKEINKITETKKQTESNVYTNPNENEYNVKLIQSDLIDIKNKAINIMNTLKHIE